MKPTNEKLHIIIPVYNEEGAVGKVIKDWSHKRPSLSIDYKICTYNDGSKDNTLSILQDLAKENKQLHVVDKINSGYGPTILKGYKENLNHFFNYITNNYELKEKQFGVDFYVKK